ncbi:MAG: YIP1 family protein [Halanaerobiales bacterium]
MLKKIARTSYLLILLILLSSVAIADDSTFSVPYYSYTYDFWQDPVMAPQPYQPLEVIDGDDIGVGGFKNPQDFYVWEDKEIYIADTGNNRIVITDQDWNLINIISEFENKGETDTFNQPYGLHVTKEGEIYIADRNNHRIVVMNSSGELLRIISSPIPDNPNLFSDSTEYNPVKVSVDNVGRTYVIADKIYDGVMEFDLEGSFRGFLGAPRISPNFIDYLWRRISPQARQDRMSLLLPTEYSNLEVDERGFIFTTVASGEISEEEAVRRLNMAGKDILKREGCAPPTGDYGLVLRNVQGEMVLEQSEFVDILSREEGIYSVLDQQRGRVFTYSYYGDLLYVFGWEGHIRGNLQAPKALAELNSRIMVIDSLLNNITVYTPTRYQELIHSAIKEYNDGEYQKSADIWRQVTKLNANYDLAYTGIGRAFYRRDNFAEAMSNFELGQDRRGYTKAFEQYRRNVIRENIYKYLIIFVIFILLILIIRKVYGKLRERLTPRLIEGIAWAETAAVSHLKADTWEISSWFRANIAILYLQVLRTVRALAYTKHVMFHPFDGFWDLKHENKGNVPAATVIILLLTITNIIQRQYTGFIFNEVNLSYLNIVFEFFSILLPFILWVTVNWSFTTLMNGKGTFKDIYIASAFALSPMIYINIPVTIISNFITMEEGSFLLIFFSISLIWSLGLLFFGTMTTHQYDTGKNTFLTVLIIMGIIFSLFISILFFNLAEQVIQFISDIYREIFMRV